MRVQRSVLAAVALTVALSAAFATALATYSAQAAGAAVHRTLEDDTQASILLTGSVPQRDSASGRDTGGLVGTGGGIQAATRSIGKRLAAALGGIQLTLYACPELESLALPGSTTENGRVATLLAPDALSAHARLVQGAWPSAGVSTNAPLPTVVSRDAAQVMHLSVGSVVDVTTPAAGAVRLTVSGIFIPLNAADPYWSLDPLHGGGEQSAIGFTTFGPFYTDPSYLNQDAPAGSPFAAEQMQWLAEPALDQVSTSGLATQSAHLTALFASLNQDDDYGGPQASTNLPQVLAGLDTAAVVAQSLVLSELLELLVVAAAALMIVVRLLTGARESEAALLWARGGTGRQLVRLRSVESLVLAVPAVIAAPLLARPLALLVGRLGAASSSGAAIAIPPLDGSAWLAVWSATGAAVLLALCVILAPAFASAVSPLALRARRSRQRAVTVVGRAGVDLGLVIVAVIACWRLLGSGSAVGSDQSGSPTLDPVSIAAPALALAAGAVVLLRLLPFGARLGERLARRGRHLPLPLALWQTGRRPLRLAGPLLLTMLAVAAGTLSLSEMSSARVSAHDQAAFGTGADVDISFGGTPPTAAQLAGYASAPGIVATTTGYRTFFFPDSASSGGEATALAVDTSTAADTLIFRPDLSTTPISSLMSELADRDARGHVPALVTTALARAEQLQVGSITQVAVGNTNIDAHVVGVLSQFPTISTPSGGIVLGEQAVNQALKQAEISTPSASTVSPNELWLRDPSGRIPPGVPASATVTVRSQVETSLRGAPLSEEPQQALLAVAAATVLLALCGMAIGVLASGGERSGEFALLAALGLSRGARIRLLMLEQGLLAVPGALAGAALGAALARVVVPVATLTADALQPQPPVVVHTPWAELGVAAAAFTAVPLLLAALAGVRRRDVSSALREGGDR